MCNRRYVIVRVRVISVVLRTGWIIEQDKGFTKDHSVSKHAQPNHLTREKAVTL